MKPLQGGLAKGLIIVLFAVGFIVAFFSYFGSPGVTRNFPVMFCSFYNVPGIQCNIHLSGVFFDESDGGVMLTLSNRFGEGTNLTITQIKVDKASSGPLMGCSYDGTPIMIQPGESVTVVVDNCPLPIVKNYTGKRYTFNFDLTYSLNDEPQEHLARGKMRSYVLPERPQ